MVTDRGYMNRMLLGDMVITGEMVAAIEGGVRAPMDAIMAAIGSAVGQFLGLRTERIRLLLACGAAAAVGGTFNAPIAGVIFALEVILGSFTTMSGCSLPPSPCTDCCS